MSGQEVSLPGVGGSLVATFLSLGLVCLLAYVVLRWLGRKGVGAPAGPIRVLARCPLEPRRSVYVIEVAGRGFVVGVGEGPMAMLGEVDPNAVVCTTVPVARGDLGRRFAELLARAMRRPTADPAASGAPAPAGDGASGAGR